MLVAPEARNPLLASSFGTGELIRHAPTRGFAILFWVSAAAPRWMAEWE